MRRIINFILDFLEKEDPDISYLEKQPQSFWLDISSPTKITDNVLYFFPYQNKVVKKAILAVKTKNNQKILSSISSIVAENLVEELAEWQTWQNFSPQIMVAIPVSNNDKGFNHSEEIASCILNQNQLGNIKLLKKALVKTRHTPIQHSLSRENRLRNLKNSMEVKYPEKIKNLDIIIIDDVTTTGATFNEAVRALKQAGANRVFCVALAH